METIIFAGIGLVVLLILLAVIKVAASQYNTVAPNTVAVVYGRNNRVGDRTLGYRIVTGGGFWKIPIFEQVKSLNLNVMTMGVEVKSVPDKNGALVNVKGVANVKILSESNALFLAIERFLGCTDQQIMNVAKENLEGNLRSIVGSLTIEELIQDRQALQARILQEVAGDLAKLGLGIDLFNIQDISDDRFYIESLGKKQTAEIIRNATIGEAEAKRDADIRSAEALKAGEIAKAKSQEEISNAWRERDTVAAQNQARIDAEKARIPIAAQIAASEEQKTLNVKLVEAEKARVKEETDLQKFERERNEAKLNASLIVQAEKDKEAKIISAQAEQDASIRIGEALRIKQEKEGEGYKAKSLNEAEGRKELAKAKEAELTAEANGTKAKLLAEAAGLEAKLTAEALGELKKAEAYSKMDETGKLLMLLQLSPSAIHAIGEVIERFMTPVADSIGKGLSNIDEVRIIDLGGSNGKNTLSEFTQLPAETIFKVIEKIQALGLQDFVQNATGINFTKLLSENGVKKEKGGQLSTKEEQASE